MGWNDIIMDRLSRSMIVIIWMRERRSWRRKRVPVVNPRDVLLIRCVLISFFSSLCLYNLLSKTGNWEYYLASLNILPLFSLLSSLLVLERDKIYVWKNEKRTRVEKSSSIPLETKGTKSGKRGKRRGRFPALNSRSSATTKLSAITIMIIITRTMMTTRRTMIRSFSPSPSPRLAARCLAAGRCPDEYPADSLSPQLYNPLSNWPSVVRPP